MEKGVRCCKQGWGWVLGCFKCHKLDGRYNYLQKW